MNDWQDADYFTGAFPTLFPYGVGGHISNSEFRPVPVSLKAWAKWALGHHSRRFARHPTFLYLAYDVLNGKGMLHLHCLVWLAGNVDFYTLRNRLNEDPDFAHRMTQYLESIIKCSIDQSNDDLTDDSSGQWNQTVPCAAREADSDAYFMDTLLLDATRLFCYFDSTEFKMITRKISREQSAAPSSHHRPIPEDGVRPTPVRTVLPLNHTLVAADSAESETSPASPSTQFHPFLVNDDDPSIPRGLPFFQERRSNIINPVDSTEITWADHYRGSQMLSWKDDAKREGAVDICIIGCLSAAYLDKALSSLYDPSYRLELSLDDETARALKRTMKSSPLDDTASTPFRLPHVAIISVKLKTLQKSDAPHLNESDPFPFLFNGRNIAKGRQSLLSSYDIEARDNAPRRFGYTLSLRCVYFLESQSTAIPSTPKNRKRKGASLVSPRKNRRPGQLAVFSDEE